MFNVQSSFPKHTGTEMGLAEAFQVSVSGLCQDAFNDIKQATATAPTMLPDTKTPIANGLCPSRSLNLKMTPISIEDEEDPLQSLACL